MKNGQPQVPNKNINPTEGNKKPENKDNLDSRKNEEWDTKGDDVTHNEKEHRSEGKKKKED